ncbi:MAG TPA: hypothetical protein VFN35_16680 [Ktedonobacteraceae bacterium]|nr:hypothetical protein [Ktedonobacteraceae bacterium]
MKEPPYPYHQPLNSVPPSSHDNPLQWYRHRPPMLQVAIVCAIVIAFLFLGIFCADAIGLATGHAALPTPITYPAP